MSEAKAGGPRVFLSTTLTADQTAFDAILPQIADTTGHAAVLAAFRASGSWAELPEVDDNCTISFVEDVEDIWPLADLLRTSDVVTRKGVEQIAFGYPRRDLAQIHRFIASSAATTPVSAGAAQVAGQNLISGSGMKAQTYNHLALLFQEDATNFLVKVFMKVRAVGAIEMSYGHSVTRIPAVFKVFAHSGFALNANIEQAFQMTGPKSA